MKRAAFFFLLAGAAACASSTPPAASLSPDSTAKQGATAAQGGDDPARALTHEECESLGQSITDACHGQNTRSAQFEAWCGDIVTGVGSGSWIADCEKHIRYMDAVCITSNTSIRSMMDCDQAVAR